MTPSEHSAISTQLEGVKIQVNGIQVSIDSMLAASQNPPVKPPVENPPVPPTTGAPVIPQYIVDYDMGDGSAGEGRFVEKTIPVGAWFQVRFTVPPGMIPNIDVFPGTGGWLCGKIIEFFPYVTDGKEYPANIGTQPRYADIPQVIKDYPQTYYYSVGVKDLRNGVTAQALKIQYRLNPK